MKFVNLEFGSGFPDVLKPNVVEILETFEAMFPLWLQTVYLEWDDEDVDNRAYIRVQGDYRRCTIIVCPGWLGLSSKIREESFLHELCHCFNAPVGEVGKAILDRMCPLGDDSTDEAVKDLYQTLQENLRKALEQCNQDLTYSVLRFRDSLTHDELPPGVHIRNKQHLKLAQN